MTKNSPQSDFSKKEIRLPDGRRLIYYDFSAQKTESPRVDVHHQERKER